MSLGVIHTLRYCFDPRLGTAARLQHLVALRHDDISMPFRLPTLGCSSIINLTSSGRKSLGSFERDLDCRVVYFPVQQLL